MPDNVKNSNYRLKLLYVYKILYENTDETHHITMPEILSQLEGYGISAGRKGVYEDIEALKTFGVDIVSGRGGNSYYSIVSRKFELPELKLLADEVSSSKFITEKKSRELVKKLGALSSKYDAKLIQRQIYVADRVKTTNEQIYLNVDILYRAITERKKISFSYFDYNIRGKKRYRSGVRICSPYALTYNNEQYYLISRYNKRPEIMTNFRVDRMEKIEFIDEPYEPMPDDFKISDYLKGTFSMFSGHSDMVKLCFKNELANAVIDRFGKSILVKPEDNEHFSFWASVNVEQPLAFFSWLFLFGTDAEIMEPESIKQQYIDILRAVTEKHIKGKEVK